MQLALYVIRGISILVILYYVTVTLDSWYQSHHVMRVYSELGKFTLDAWYRNN